MKMAKCKIFGKMKNCENGKVQDFFGKSKKCKMLKNCKVQDFLEKLTNVAKWPSAIFFEKFKKAKMMKNCKVPDFSKKKRMVKNENGKVQDFLKK